MDLAALVAALLSIILGIASSQALNADGVSYLDLAAAVRDGDWRSAVQGYWSPLYPLLLALSGTLAGNDTASLLAVAHGLNVVIALSGIALLWLTFRRLENPVPGRLAFAAWLLASARPPRVDALTPDLLLTVLLLALALELTGAARPFRVGVFLGAIFLTKTSAWPWVVVVLVLEAWRHRGRVVPLLRTSLACLAIMLTWVVPLSVKSGALTIESAGSLNTCWYLRACDSRTPDTHAGEHRDYRQTIVEGKTMLWAAFDSTRWTYAPWSDPTAWAAGVRTNAGHAPTGASLVSYWGRQLGTGLRLWLWPVTLGVLLPAFLMRRWSGAVPDLNDHDRAAIAVAVAGAIGVAQFFVIHAEPRLIGPYLLSLAIGCIAWCIPRSSAAIAESGRPRTTGRAGKTPRWRAVTCAGYGIAVPFAVISLRDAFTQRQHVTNRVAAIASALAPLRLAGVERPRIVLVGFALPVLTDAWRVRGRVVAQVRPSSALQLVKSPPEEQQRLTALAFAHSADVLWFADADGSIRMGPAIP